MLKGLILGALGVVLAAGCTMTPATNDIPVDRRVTLAADLADDMVVTDLRCVRGPSGHLELQANVVNNLAEDRGVEWRVVWLDASGLEIESVVSNWAKRMVSAKDIAEIRSVAPSQAAVDFRFHLRRLRR